MASRQFLRRWSPLLRTAPRQLQASRPAVQGYRQAVVSQTLASRLTPVRCMSKDVPLDIVNIQDKEDFREKVMESKKTVVVDFHATWCGPCKLLGPRLEAIIAAEKGKVTLAKVDIDECVDLAMHYKVQSVPTVYGVKDGKIKNTFIGLKNDDEIKSFIKGL